MSNDERPDTERLFELRQALERSALTLLIDSSRQVLEVSEGFARLAGQSAQALEGRRLEDLLVEGFPTETLGAALTAIGFGLSWRGELQFASHTGESFWIELTLVPLASSGRVQAIGFDVTERKLVEIALAEAHGFQEILMELAPVGLLLANERGECTYVNDRWAKISGRRLRKAIGESWLEAVHPEDRSRIAAHWGKAVADGSPFSTEIRYQSESGGCRWVHAVAVRIEPAAGAGRSPVFLRIEQDLTEQREAEARLEEQKARNMSAAKLASLGEMASGIAHEINNPLGVIHAKAGQLAERLEGGALDAQWAINAAQTIESNCERIARIIRSMRDVSREAHEGPLERTGLAPLAESAVALCAARFRHEKVDVTLETRGSPTVSCRPGEISQALLSLLSNAFDAAKSSEAKWIRLTVGEEGDSAFLKIEDSGRGVAPEIREKIFQPFFTTKPTGTGMGLGLSLAAAIAKGHEGTLTLEPGGRGASFVLRLAKLTAAAAETRAA